MRRRLMSVLLAVVSAAGAGCGDSESGPPDADDLGGKFGKGTVNAAVGLLAGANVQVRVRPDDESPMVDVAAPSAVSLLRFQVRNLALEANAGGGTLGGDLDTFTEAAGGLSISYLIAGWAETAGTPAARTAAALLGDAAGADPRRMVVPGMVVALFLGDVTGPASAATAEPAAVQGFRRSASAAAAEPDEDDFCGQVSAYLAAALSDVLDPDIALQPQWLQAAIDRYAPFESDPQRLRNAVAAMSLYVYATSIAKPWVPLLVSNPLGEVHYLVGENTIPASTELRLTVDTGDGFFAEEAEECAALAGLQLTDTEVEGSEVSWVVDGLLPHVQVNSEGPGGDLELDEDGHASFEYEPIVETPDAHKKGTQQTAVVPVGASVRREEIAELQGLLKGLLTGGELGVASPEVFATYERLEPMLVNLLDPRARTSVTVTWHAEKPPEDETGMGGNGCRMGCAGSNGDPHLVPVEGAAYDFQAAGEFVLLRSEDGALEVQARQVPVESGGDVALNDAVTIKAGEHRVGLYAADDGVEVRLDGDPIELAGEVDLGDGARMSPHERGVEVESADGTMVWLMPTDAYGIEVLIDPSDEIRDGSVGLLGVSANHGYGLPPMPDGSVVPEPSSRGDAFELLYGEYEEAWRVTAETSLFDYEPGESPDSFVVDGFPARPLLYEDLTADQLALGTEPCAAVAPEELRQSCVVDVVATGDVTYADVYGLTATVIEDAGDALGEPGPLIEAVPVVVSESDSTSDDEFELEQPAIAVSESRAGEPTATMSGELVEPGERLAARVAVEAGTVLLARVGECSPGAVVFVDVTSVDRETANTMFACDPNTMTGALMDEDDEFVDGEGYVWLTEGGVYDVFVSVSADADTPTPISVELFTDPTPTVVGQDDLTDGDSITLSGIGDTIVYEFDGSATEGIDLTSVGLDVACAFEAWGAPEFGSGDLWTLHYCEHTTTPAAGLSVSGYYVPLIVFARTDEAIEVILTPVG